MFHSFFMRLTGRSLVSFALRGAFDGVEYNFITPAASSLLLLLAVAVLALFAVFAGAAVALVAFHLSHFLFSLSICSVQDNQHHKKTH